MWLLWNPEWASERAQDEEGPAQVRLGEGMHRTWEPKRVRRERVGRELERRWDKGIQGG